MRKNLFRWAEAVAMPERALEFNERIEPLSYFERVKFVNDVLGCEWMFRLEELKGRDTILNNRESWYNFYHDDVYGLHIPLDPRAPETDDYLGEQTGAMEFAFYAALGFDGYSLVLETQRESIPDSFNLLFDQYEFEWLTEDDVEGLYNDQGNIEPDTYYRVYGEALEQIFSNFDSIMSDPSNDDLIENTAAASLILACGSHRGCGLPSGCARR